MNRVGLVGRGGNVSLLAVALAVGALGLHGAHVVAATERQKRLLGPKCLLPGCAQLAKRGGYCCADHCREHQAARKARKAVTA